MIHLDGMEHADKNGNRFAEVYTLIQSNDYDESFDQQLNIFRRAIRIRGLEPVHVSAYWKYDPLFNGIPNNTRHIKNIRRHLSIPPEMPRGENDHDMVFVWNIGDITMMTRDHIEELRMLRPDINLTMLNNLKERICEGVNGLEDSMNIIRKVDNIEDALSGETDEMRRAAPMYDALKQLYNGIQYDNRDEKRPKISHDLLEKLGLLEQEKELCQIVKKHQKVYHQRWKYVRRCMELVNRRSAKSETRKYANVVMCEEGVASAAGELILAGLSSLVPIDQIYSRNALPGEVGKSLIIPGDARSIKRLWGVIERIRRRFGANCGLVYVASSWTIVGQRILKWRIESNESIKILYDLQKETL